MDLKALAKGVKAARLAAGLTQAKLAELAGVTDETISRLERGAFEPSLSTMVAVTSAIGMDAASWLMPGRHPLVARDVNPENAPLLTRLLESARDLSNEELAALIRVADLLLAAREPRNKRSPAK